MLGKDAFDAFFVDVGVGGFVEDAGVDDAVLDVVVDEVVDEADLVGGEKFVVEIFGEGVFGGVAIQSGQGADEAGEVRLGAVRALELFTGA